MTKIERSESDRADYPALALRGRARFIFWVNLLLNFWRYGKWERYWWLAKNIDALRLDCWLLGNHNPGAHVENLHKYYVAIFDQPAESKVYFIQLKLPNGSRNAGFNIFVNPSTTVNAEGQVGFNTAGAEFLQYEQVIPNKLMFFPTNKITYTEAQELTERYRLYHSRLAKLRLLRS